MHTPEAIKTPLPQFLCDLLAAPPRHGDGVHSWLYRVARQLHAHRNESEACDLLAAALDGCGRTVSAKEIADAVRSSQATAWQPNGARAHAPIAAQPKWPAINAEQRAAVLAEMEGFGLADLWEASQCRWDDREAHTNDIIASLFPPDSLLCAGMDMKSAITAPVSEWLGEDMTQLQLIVPSPMTALIGTNQDGNESRRCLDNTGPRRFLVIECDHGTINEQAAILRWLSLQAPLALTVHSGGKSLHGWFYCAGQQEDKLKAFMRLAVTIGADHAMWTRCQLARMPDGTRLATAERHAMRQAVYYFNPSVCQ